MFPILHLHHVTATVKEAQPDLDFYRGLLGLRLVKQTINFDNTGVYHFYYGTETGYPGTIMTTFPYAGKGVREGKKGHGQVSETAFSVPIGSMGFWEKRLKAFGVACKKAVPRFGAHVLTFRDPAGLDLALVEGRDDARPPWKSGGIPPDRAICGLHSVTLDLADLVPTEELLAGPLNFHMVGKDDDRVRYQTPEAQPGSWIDLRFTPDAPPGKNGIGTVHHVALGIDSDEAQLQLRAFLVEQGYRVTDIKDRKYFRSIYFREKGGVLFEVATLDPGFPVDEAPEELGTHLMLPDWAEGQREEIEAKLPGVEMRDERSD